MAIASKPDEIRVNEEIRSERVRLISEDGTQLGIMSVREALNIAMDKGLDLVEVASNVDPSVCRIMDYGKFKYQASKKEQEGRKKGKSFQIKEIKFRPHTDDHDLEYKIRNLRKFLVKKSRVKLTVMFRGRELAYKDAGLELLNKIAEDLTDVGSVDQMPKQEGRNLTMVMAPK
ncbi:MAG: translation initiation factor IF-3 [Deltaproteobacteria bacterium]|nr:translation initiation factor IF-3 [Deltaproteobacteria bacterium]